MKRHLLRIATLICLAVTPIAPCFADDAEPSFKFSGFSRVVAGILDDENASFEGYDDSVSFGERSLLGLQLDAQLTEKMSVTTQLLAHSSDTRDSGVEWLYLTYQPSKSVRLKAGRMRSPFFSYSDVLDVGFAYPWISPPQQVYNAYLFDYYDGVSATYEVSAPDFSLELDGYYGRFDDTLSIGNAQDVNANTNNFAGFSVVVRGDKLQARLSSHSGDVDVELPELSAFADILRMANYPLTADSLSTSGRAKAQQISVAYDELDYFLKAEFIKISAPILVVPKIQSYYFTAGYILYPFTFHATYANNSSSYSNPVTEIPTGRIPQLDQLAAGYSAIYDNLPDDSVESVTLGVRWDFRISMALKAEITHLRGTQGERSFFEISNPEVFDRRANLVQVAWEWVF